MWKSLTLQPSLRSSSTHALPIPAAPPVIRATLPRRSMLVGSWVEEFTTRTKCSRRRPSTAWGGSKDHTPHTLPQQYAEKKSSRDLWKSQSVGRWGSWLDAHWCAGVSGARGVRPSSPSCTCTTAAPSHGSRPCAAGCISWRSLIERGRKIHAETAQAGGFFLAGGQADTAGRLLFSQIIHGPLAALCYVPECECISHNAPLLLIFVCSVHAERMIHQTSSPAYLLCTCFSV